MHKLWDRYADLILQEEMMMEIKTLFLSTKLKYFE